MFVRPSTWVPATAMRQSSCSSGHGLSAGNADVDAVMLVKKFSKMPWLHTRRKVIKEAEEPTDKPSLVDLPKECLDQVLRCCTNDPATICSAARAHSRLRQAAAVVLSSITVCLRAQQQADHVLLYLSKHGQHVNSIEMSVDRGSSKDTFTMRGLPYHLRPDTLVLKGGVVGNLHLQLQPGGGFGGVLGAAAAWSQLTRLELKYCTLTDGIEGLEAVLSELSGLENLSIDPILGTQNSFPINALYKLQQLTYLFFNGRNLYRQTATFFQPLQALTRLAELRIDAGGGKHGHISASRLSGTQQLTRLEILQGVLDPAALACHTQLQHLKLSNGYWDQEPAWVGQLLSQLQHLQQLTHFDFEDAWESTSVREYSPLPAAYSALTASSKLQYLNLSCCTLPPTAWQYVFPASGRQLPHLKTLNTWGVFLPDDMPTTTTCFTAPPEPSSLASCCPNLTDIKV